MISQVRSLYESQPFRPFSLHLADGRAITIANKEFLSSSPSGAPSWSISPLTRSTSSVCCSSPIWKFRPTVGPGAAKARESMLCERF